MSDGQRPPGRRVYGSASSFRYVTMAAGWLLVAFALFMYFAMLDEHADPDTAFWVSGLIAALGLLVVSSGARYKREWIVVDDEGISKPWAFARTHLLWKDVTAIRPKKHLKLVIQNKSGRKLSVTRSLPDHNDLVDRICLELNRARGPVERKAWLTAGNGFTIEAEDLVLENSGKKRHIPFKSARRVVFGVDARSQVVLQLALVDGNYLALPPVDPTLSFDALRAISSILHGGNRPSLSSAQREQDASMERKVERRVEYQMVRRAFIAPVLVYVYRSLRECSSPSRR